MIVFNIIPKFFQDTLDKVTQEPCNSPIENFLSIALPRTCQNALAICPSIHLKSQTRYENNYIVRNGE